MALRIFETDPDAKPKARNPFMDDVVGKFKGGKLVGRRPMALSEWRVISDDPDVADRIAELFGGEAVDSGDEEARDRYEVMSEAESVLVVVESAEALRSRMALYGLQGPLHVCDGAYLIAGHPEEDRIGQPCECPRGLQDRKDKAKSGTGPKPDISLRFRLKDDPELGYFVFGSGSWSLVNDLPEIERQLADADGPVIAELRLTLVEYTTKKGRDVSYTRPEIVIKGAA
ncbi:MAG: hypothetical protein ABIQ18_39765 [Umezawaea sp.]